MECLVKALMQWTLTQVRSTKWSWVETIETPNFQLGIGQGPMFRPFPGFEILVTRVDRYASRLALDCSGGPCLIWWWLPEGVVGLKIRGGPIRASPKAKCQRFSISNV
jgi:hypothetical protein